MRNFNTNKYSENEITLARQLLEKNPDDAVQKDRLSYWLGKKGDFEEAEKYAVSDKMKDLLRQWKN